MAHQKSKDNPISSPVERLFPIVGIGASAGGLEALERFFSNMPADSGMAFVVIVHLAPDHKSHLSDLLKNQTPMQTQEITENTPIEPNQIYVAVPQKKKCSSRIGICI